jgi:hypothetical protein
MCAFVCIVGHGGSEFTRVLLRSTKANKKNVGVVPPDRRHPVVFCVILLAFVDLKNKKNQASFSADCPSFPLQSDLVPAAVAAASYLLGSEVGEP